MTPTDRRTALVRLLAKIDQQIAEAESLATCQQFTEKERTHAAERLDFDRQCVVHIEGILGKMDAEC